MKAWRGLLGVTVFAVGLSASCAQTPVLGGIEAPYPALQSQVSMAGRTYVPGSVTYGPAGTPLVLTGSDLGASGTVQFVGYKNGAVDPGATVQATSVTMWTSNMIFLAVPAGAVSGLVTVTVEGKTSNGIPFMVTPGNYIPPVAQRFHPRANFRSPLRRCTMERPDRRIALLGRDRRHRGILLVDYRRCASHRPFIEFIHGRDLRHAEQCCGPIEPHRASGGQQFASADE